MVIVEEIVVVVVYIYNGIKNNDFVFLSLKTSIFDKLINQYHSDSVLIFKLLHIFQFESIIYPYMIN